MYVLRARVTDYALCDTAASLYIYISQLSIYTPYALVFLDTDLLLLALIKQAY
jgi:hypothetical protein